MTGLYRSKPWQWKKGPTGSGQYFLVGTPYSVEKSADDRWWDDEGGYGPGHMEGGGIEWIMCEGDENIAFFDTLGEAKQATQELAARDQERSAR